MDEIQNKLRAIPAIDQLLAAASSQPVLAIRPHALVVEALREATSIVRDQIKNGQSSETSMETILQKAAKLLQKAEDPSLKRVINATGVILHTNLGRAPLSRRASEHIAAVAGGYSNLEYEVDSGQRGHRYSHVRDRICALTGAEDALVVNNNAAAVLLALTALASGREVIVSRGQLVEIGGSFRIPDVMRQSGATMVEVGTTNKTHIHDYEQAIGPNTAALLKVHTSNYRIIGFTAQPSEAALVELARSHNLPIIEDLGSGSLVPMKAGSWQEPAVGERIAAGIDVITFSGDKLLGGAQAGVIVGKKMYLKAMSHHPLMRALRVDKLCLAATEGTMMDYALGNPLEDIPVLKMMHMTPPELKGRAIKLADELKELGNHWQVEVKSIDSQVGGGALPEVDFASFGVAVKMGELSAEKLEKQLRIRPVPVIARIHDNCVILDVRCLASEELSEIVQICAEIGKR